MFMYYQCVTIRLMTYSLNLKRKVDQVYVFVLLNYHNAYYIQLSSITCHLMISIFKYENIFTAVGKLAALSLSLYLLQ